MFCRVFTRFVASVAKAKAATKAGIQKAKGHCSRCLRCMLRLIGIKSKHHSHANHGSGVPHRGPDGTVELPTHIKTRPGFHDGHPHLQPVDINVAPERGFFGRAIHVMWVAFKIALIPILIGIAFGMTASAIGMLVGQLVVLLWMRHRRQAEAPVYERLDLDFKEEIPPPYEDAPSTNVEVVNEKEVEDKA